MARPRFIKNVLYRLERAYGTVIHYHRLLSVQQNAKTGVDQKFEDIFRIPRAVVMDNKIIRDFEYDLSFIASNKNFTYGGQFDTSTRLILLRRKFLPTNYESSVDDRFVFASKNWEIKSVTEYGNSTLGYVFVVKELKGSPLNGN